MLRFTLIFLVLSLLSCQRDGTDVISTTVIPTTTGPTGPSVPVTGSISGFVTAEDTGEALPGATISYDGASVLSDLNGQFSFTDVRLFADGTVLTVLHEDYFEGSRRFLASENEIHRIEVELIRKELVEEILSSSGGPVQVGRASVDLPSGTYRAADSGYDGGLRIFGRWLDPTLESTHDQLPGDLTGMDADGNLLALASFGIMKIEILSEDNEVVQLPEGQTARMFFPIPNSLSSIAPDELALWFYDEQNGAWIPDGVAFRDDDFYVADVDHFTYWSINLNLDHVVLNGPVFIDGQPSSNAKVRVSDSETGFLAYGHTSETGLLSMSVPIGSMLTIETRECSNLIYTTTISDIQGDDIYEIDLKPEGQTLDISGQVVDCDGAAFAGALVRLDYGNESEVVKADDQGRFEVENLDRCRLTVYGINGEDSMVSRGIDLTSSRDDLVLQTCHTAAVDFDISYDPMSWTLEESDVTYEFSYINGSDPITIVHLVIMQDGIVIVDGAFRLRDSDLSSATFFLTFHVDNFNVSGTADLQIVDTGLGFSTFSFSGMDVDNPIGISNLILKMVYHD